MPILAVVLLPILILIAALLLWRTFAPSADGEVCERIEKRRYPATGSTMLSTSELRQALVIEKGKVMASPQSPSRKSQVAQPKVNEGPATGPALSSRRPWHCVELSQQVAVLGHGLRPTHQHHTPTHQERQLRVTSPEGKVMI